jgi:signal transduction histidine kinase
MKSHVKLTGSPRVWMRWEISLARRMMSIHPQSVESGEPLDVVMEIKRPDQGNRLSALHLRRFTVGDASGSVLGSGLLLRDVTREHELDEFKTTLLAAVGHELRTPLAVIKGYASTLLQDDVVWTQADQQQFLQTISKESDRVARLVSNLLDLSRQEAGLLSLKCSPVHIPDLLTTTIERLQQPGITFSVQVQPDLPLVNVDSDRVEVVLYNLLSNALTYGENEVFVRVQRQEERIIVAVTDNGPGIASEELPHIFERFYRARHGRQRRSAC